MKIIKQIPAKKDHQKKIGLFMKLKKLYLKFFFVIKKKFTVFCLFVLNYIFKLKK